MHRRRQWLVRVVYDRLHAVALGTVASGAVEEERHPSAPGVLHGVMYASASATGLRLRMRLFARTCHLELLEGLVAQRVKQEGCWKYM